MTASDSTARLQVLAAALAGKPVFWLVVVAAIFSWPILRSIQAARELPQPRPVLGQVRDFSLRDPSGEALGATDLRGRIWVASFGSCEPGCAGSEPILTALEQVRHRTRNLGDRFRLVTFVVGADGTAAGRLRELSARHRAGHGSWRFVSGPPERMGGIFRDLRIAGELERARVALIDDNLSIRGYYDPRDEEDIAALLRDVSLLLAPGG